MQKKAYQPNKGEAALYMKRSAALRKLGLSLADFRRLCILKGIFPRVPKKKLEGRDRVYYSVKDIKDIMREPLLSKFHEQKILTDRIKKAYARDDITKAGILNSEIEEINVNGIIRERYPALVYALHDLDDALSTLALFANATTDGAAKINANAIRECRELMDHWYTFVMATGCLNKTFASIKGMYFEAEILGEKILWLQPHEFSQNKASEVDFRVMSTFLVLYRSLVRLVLFKVYFMAGYQYPPKKINDHAKAPGRFLNYCVVPHDQPIPILSGADDETVVPSLISQTDEAQSRRTLFAKQTFFIGQENNVYFLAFVLRSCGARSVGFHEASSVFTPLSKIANDSPAITHQIADLPKAHFKSLQERCGDAATSRVFVQPQWILDSVNNCALLPEGPFIPGVVPPVHLSPFDKSYTPAAQLQFDKWAGKELAELEPATDDEEENNITEEKRRALLTMSRTKRDLYAKIKKMEDLELSRAKKLKKKAAQLSAGAEN